MFKIRTSLPRPLKPVVSPGDNPGTDLISVDLLPSNEVRLKQRRQVTRVPYCLVWIDMLKALYKGDRVNQFDRDLSELYRVSISATRH